MNRFFNFLFKPKFHKDICICGHKRNIHGELFLRQVYNDINLDSSRYGCFYSLRDGIRQFCSCEKFKMDNLKTLESRYDRSIKWKSFLNF